MSGTAKVGSTQLRNQTVCEPMKHRRQLYVGVSENSGIPKSSILIGFSIINHPFWGTPIVGNTHVVDSPQIWRQQTSIASLSVFLFNKLMIKGVPESIGSLHDGSGSYLNLLRLHHYIVLVWFWSYLVIHPGNLCYYVGISCFTPCNNYRSRTSDGQPPKMMCFFQFG